MTEEMRFGFGANWESYLAEAGEAQRAWARKDLLEWLPETEIRGKRVVDIGSGSGVHSLAFHQAGCAELVSFDYDGQSVAATRALWEQAGRPGNWSVGQGSVLDGAYLESLGTFDIVYSWGVLHHTGAMWAAIENAYRRVRPGGWVLTALYVAGPRYGADLALKQRYNLADEAGKRAMEKSWIRGLMWQRLREGKNPFAWNQSKERGMKVYYDIVDWLGGYPYEVAGPREVIRHARGFGLVLEKVDLRGEGSCNTYLFRSEHG